MVSLSVSKESSSDIIAEEKLIAATPLDWQV